MQGQGSIPNNAAPPFKKAVVLSPLSVDDAACTGGSDGRRSSASIPRRIGVAIRAGVGSEALLSCVEGVTVGALTGDAVGVPVGLGEALGPRATLLRDFLRGAGFRAPKGGAFGDVLFLSTPLEHF